ncbi:MAG: caspase family protein [Caldilineaceae bacterium]|nr:caspase family protein [Caldilineaceae bacterium]
MQEFARSRAVIVGINAYQNGIHSLRTPACDAIALALALRKQHGYFPVYLRKDRRATLDGLRTLLYRRLPHSTDERERLLFYFAGHGVALPGKGGPEGFLLPQDAQRDNRDSYLPMQELSTALEKLGYHHLLIILDCCFAGAFSWASGRETDLAPDSVLYRERFAHYIDSPTWQVLTSAWYDQRALDVAGGYALGNRENGDEHSPFAAGLLAALGGRADILPQPDGDGVILASELIAYLEVWFAQAHATQNQTPMLWRVRPEQSGQYLFLNPGHALNLPPTPPLQPDDNPYLGLKSYSEADRALFFGREALADQLADDLPKRPLTIVLGASGAGKTSLVQAGLLPRLRARRDVRWHLLEVIRPGTSPLTTLEALRLPSGGTLGEWCAAQGVTPATRPSALGEALGEALQRTDPSQQLPPDKVLLVVDQLEELLTMGDAPARRDQFLQQVVRGLESLPGRLHVVFTLRSDFEPQFDRPDLRPYWQPAARFVVPLLGAAELREVIVKPAAGLGLRLEPSDLVDEIIAEVAQMPGALPLLSFTLSEMYLRYLRRQDAAQRVLQILDRSLTRQDYQALGGVTGAIRQRAESLYETLDPLHRRTLRRVMLRMVAVEHATARRRVYQTELVYTDVAENERVEWMLARLRQERLVVADADAQGPYYEPGHDALVLSWPRLSGWIRDEQQKPDSLTFQRRMTQAAQEWENLTGRDARQGQRRSRWMALGRQAQDFFSVIGRETDALLWSSAERSALLELILVRATHWMNAPEVRFAEASVRHHRRRRQLGLAVIAVLALLALAASSAALRSELLRRVTLREQSRLLSTLSEQQLTVDPAAAIKLALDALPSAEQPRPYLAAAEFAISRALQASLENEYQAPAERIVLEPLEIAHGEIALADDTGLKVLPYLPHLQQAAVLTTTRMTGIGWNPVDNTKLLAYAARGVMVWQGGRIAAQQQFPDRVLCAVWHPAGDEIAVCAGSRLWLWRASSPPEAIAVLAGKVQAAQWSPQGRRLAAYDDTQQIVLWDNRLRQMVGKPVANHAWATQMMAWSADDDHLVTSARGSVHVWSASRGEMVAEATHGSRVGGLIFDTGTLSKTFLVWGQDGPPTRMSLEGTPLYTYTVAAAAPSRRHDLPFWDGDARRMVTVDEGRNTVWNLAVEPPSAQPLDLEATVVAAGWYSPYLATGDKDNRLHIWDTTPMAQGRPPQHVLELFGHSRRADMDIASVEWRRGATVQLLSVSSDGSMRVWDVFDAGGRPLCADGDAGSAPICNAHYHRAAYTAAPIRRAQWLGPDTVAALREDCVLLVWTMERPPQEYATPWQSGCDVAWSPAGDRALVYTTDPDTPAPYGAIVELATGARAAAFSAPIVDARWLEAGLLLSEQAGTGAVTRLIDPDQPPATGTVLTLSGDLDAVDATEDLIAAPGVSNTLVIVDAGDGRSTVLPGSRGVPLALAWHNNGNILVSMASVVTPTLSVEVLMWNVADRAARPVWASAGQNPRSAIAVASDVSLLAVVTNTLTTVIDMVEGEPWWTWDPHGSEGVNGMQWITQSSWRGRGKRPLLLTWSGDGSVRVWDVQQQGEILRLSHTTGVEFAAANADGSGILTVDAGGTLHIWRTWWKDRAALVQLAKARAARLLPSE